MVQDNRWFDGTPVGRTDKEPETVKNFIIIRGPKITNLLLCSRGKEVSE